MYRCVKVILSLFLPLFYHVEQHGDKHAAALEGGALVCCNHRHWIDPLLISTYYPKQIRWMAKKELFSNRIVSAFLKSLKAISVDRDGLDMRSLMSAVKQLKAGLTMGIFPEGTRVKDGEFVKAKPGVALLALKGDATIVPVYIKSSYRLFSRIDLYWGSPFRLPKAEGRMNASDYGELADLILARIMRLGDKEIA